MNMKPHGLAVCVLSMAIALPATAEARDGPVTAKQRAGIERALARAGCKVAGKIERDDGGFEVERARCGQRWYEINLDARYRIIKRERKDRDDD